MMSQIWLNIFQLSASATKIIWAYTIKYERCDHNIILQYSQTLLILTVYDSTHNVVYRGFTAMFIGRGESHNVAYTGFPHYSRGLRSLKFSNREYQILCFSLF